MLILENLEKSRTELLQTAFNAESKFESRLAALALLDAQGLIRARESYGESWCKRGGVGAFMMLARKWDRLEEMLSKAEDKYDVLETVRKEVASPGPSSGEQLLDTIRDLRRYLMLVEEKLLEDGDFAAQAPFSRDNQ